MSQMWMWVLVVLLLLCVPLNAQELCRTVLDQACDCGSCSWLYKLKEECAGKNLAYCARHGYYTSGKRSDGCCHPDIVKVSAVVVAIAIAFGSVGSVVALVVLFQRGTFQGLLTREPSGHLPDDEPNSGYGHRVTEAADGSPSKFRSTLYNRANLYRDAALGAPASLSSRQ